MGKTGQAERLSDAAGRRALGGLAARRPLSAFWRDQSGATAVEVGVIVVLISIALIGAMTVLSDGIKTAFTKSADAMGS